MRATDLRPLRQIFVCTNALAAEDPMRSGCGASGPAVFVALKSAVLRRGLTRDVWVTGTGCLGHCPRRGCSVVIHPANEHLVEVEPGDAMQVLHAATRPSQDAGDEPTR